MHDLLHKVDQKEANAYHDFSQGLCLHVKRLQVLPNLKWDRITLNQNAYVYTDNGTEKREHYHSNVNDKRAGGRFNRLKKPLEKPLIL